jgi:putative Ca2+/H+ antiporter (TMEM165/GDT1 family)
MKKIIFCLAISLLTATAYAQPVAKTFSTKTPVKILEWGSRSVYLLDGYWEMATPQLQKKLSKKLVDSIKNYNSEFEYPASLKTSLENNEAKPDKNDLKMYLVATYNNNFNGTFHGVVNIIWVPRAENKNWSGFIWKNDFFFIFPKDAVEVITKE